MTGADAAGESTEVSWPIGSTTVDGTLCRPSGPGPFPAVVLVAGSGPTDRDWCSPLLPGNNGSGRLLAEALARAGIASLRYDKRAVGPHARENLEALRGKVSMRSHVDELAQAVRTLAEQDFVRRGRVCALTNSEGALHALNYQLGTPAIPFAGLVLTAPPGRPVGAVARAQLAAQAAAVPGGEALLSLYDAAVARFLAEEPIAPDPALPEGVQQLLQSLASPTNLPFSRELWVADAAASLRQIDVPVLILIGKADIQVDWRSDGQPLQRAAAALPDATFVFPEHANHILKHEPAPRETLTAGDVAARYNRPESELDPETMTAIVRWLAAHA